MGILMLPGMYEGEFALVPGRLNIGNSISKSQHTSGYILDFTPPLDRRDGKMHTIELKLRRETQSTNGFKLLEATLTDGRPDSHCSCEAVPNSLSARTRLLWSGEAR